MTKAGNVQVVQTMYDAFNAHDIDSVLECLADDIQWHIHGRETWTREDLKGLLSKLFSAHADLRWEQGFAFAGEDGWVCSEARAGVTDKKTGERVEWGSMTAFRTSDDKVLEAREYTDNIVGDAALGIEI